MRNFSAYVKYLSVPPRRLLDSSENLWASVERGEFYSATSQHPYGLEEEASTTTNMTTKAGMTKTEISYEHLVELVKQSDARDPRQFIDWGMKLTNPDLRREVCVKYFSKANFDRLVTKALDMINIENQQSTWREALQTITKPANCRMSVERSVEFIKTFCKHNDFPLKQSVDDIRMVLDKLVGKVNTIVFKGPSSAGKSKIANSIKFSFRSFADISQGIQNNFWLESAVGKRIILHEEPQFNE